MTSEDPPVSINVTPLVLTALLAAEANRSAQHHQQQLLLLIGEGASPDGGSLDLCRYAAGTSDTTAASGPPLGYLVVLKGEPDALLRARSDHEVRLSRPLLRSDIAEVQQAPRDIALGLALETKYRCGRSPTVAELIWCGRRREVEGLLARTGTRSRMTGAPERSGKRG